MKEIKLILLLLLSVNFLFGGNEVPNFFVPNKGQLLYNNGESAKDVLYYSNLGDVTMLFKKDRISYVIKKSNKENIEYYNSIGDTNDRLADSLYLEDSTYYYQMDLVFKSSSSEMTSKLNKTSDVFYQYILAHCEKGIKVHPSGELVYSNIYPGIDIKFYTKNNGLKYDIVVNPGADVDDLKLEYVGAELERLEDKIRITTPIKSWTENIPFSYLVSEESKEGKVNEEIQVRYNLEGNQVSFSVSDYDKNKTLVIDPDLTWSTYYNIKQEFN